MVKYAKILVGVDGSSQSKRALNRAISLALTSGAELMIAVVQNDGKFLNMSAGRASLDRQSRPVVDGSRQQLILFLDRCVDQARDAGVKVKSTIYYGNAKTELASILPQKIDADLIVVGATGVSRMERVLLGSTAGFIVAHAQVDVLVVKI